MTPSVAMGTKPLTIHDALRRLANSAAVSNLKRSSALALASSDFFVWAATSGSADRSSKSAMTESLVTALGLAFWQCSTHRYCRARSSSMRRWDRATSNRGWLLASMDRTSASL